MGICLCNLSADKLLEYAARNKLELTPASPNPSSFTADSALVRELLGDLREQLPDPIELIVGSAKARRGASNLACHMWRGPLTGSCFLALSDELYVTSPELTLLHQANQLHQANLAQMLGRYLGTWTPAPDKENGQETRAPLTTFESLNDFLMKTGRVMGKSNLKLAMAYTCEGAASGPETSTQLVFCFPKEMHGFGLPLPIMNYGVDLSPASQRLCGRESIRIDLCWRRARFGIEYQGKEHGNQPGEDYARWFAARKEGYELWFVAKEQLEDAYQMNYIGREVAKRIGFTVDERKWPSENELQDLLDILSGRKSAAPVGYSELRGRRRVRK